MASRFLLVVTDGPDAGARLRASPELSFIGRGEGVHLQLCDELLSRRHLSVAEERHGIHVEALGTAAAFRVDGRDCRSAVLMPGQSLSVGETTFRVEGDVAGDGVIESVDSCGLLSGRVFAVRALGMLVALIEALEGSFVRSGIDAALAGWARANGLGASAQLVDEADVLPAARERPSDVIVLADRLIVPAHAIERAWLAVEASTSADLDDDHRRLLIVAARLAGSALARVRSLDALQADRTMLRRHAVGSAHAFLGSSSGAREIERRLPKLAGSDATVLLLGQSGVGKSFVARLLHETGARVREPLVVMNCAAIPEQLVEAELFGHEKGAFTGAVRARAGACEAAGAGTLFLDEVAELSAGAQAKLLRVLEERRFERVGSRVSTLLRARIVTATNRDLAAMVKAKQFREDLFYRIAVVQLTVPPLRERLDDIELLATQMLHDLARRPLRGFSVGALAAMKRHTWPGNVRELRNVIEQALVYGEGDVIEIGDMPSLADVREPRESHNAATVALPANVAWLERANVEAALRATGGNRTRASVLLGINRVSLQKMLRRDPLLDGAN